MQGKQSHRKDEHVSLAVKFHKETSIADFDQINFIPNSLPNIAIDEVNYQTKIGDISLKTPFYIEAMTGGSKYTNKLNEQLAKVAKKTGLAMASGSESVALKDPSLVDSFSIIRETNPQGLVFANIGANASVSDAQEAIKILKADALEIHLNAVQELIMPEGQRDFASWKQNIQKIIETVNVPVIVKEVGFGMSSETIKTLKDMGVKYINVGGFGGTNFAQIENYRRKHKEMSYFDTYGLTTVKSLFEATKVSDINVIAAGGITNPMEIVKALYLGADAVGIASAILVSLNDNGLFETINFVNQMKYGVKAVMCALGAKDIKSLRKTSITYGPDLLNYLNQRK